MREIPLYKCHKEVRAFKITRMVPMSKGSQLWGEDGHTQVDLTYVIKHKPEVGGYFVQYEDGYISYSPAKAFEEGYSIVVPLIK